MATAQALSGCNSAIEKYVKDKRPDQKDTPAVTINSPMTLKLTPGKMNGSGSGIALQGTITATNEAFTLGSDKALTLTISRSRVVPQ